MKIFGPVPSRRLGKSVGVNNIPPKICSLSCVYCQVGRSTKMMVDRHDFFSPDDLVGELGKKLEQIQKNNERVDYITFVSDGEPTLDKKLGKSIELFKQFGIKIAVITNATLLYKNDVREDLMLADWVSVKIDSVEEKIWKKIDRPHYELNLSRQLDGILEFSENYTGELVTETMLIKNINDSKEILENTSDFISRVNPKFAYLSIPTRPPAETWATSPSEDKINLAYQIFENKKIKVEYLIGYEGNSFAFTGNPEEDLLSITAVHPMRRDAVDEYLKKAGADYSVVEKIISSGKLRAVNYDNSTFYIRSLK